MPPGLPATATAPMRHVPAIVAACMLAGAAAWLCAGGEPAPAGLRTFALLTFAVAAFSGPIR